MTSHTDTSSSDDLVERLRGDKYTCRENMGCGSMEFCACATMDDAADCIEALEAQIDRLASFIMHCIEGEPSQSQGAVDTAIRIMTEQATTIGKQLAEVEGLRDLLVRGYVVCDGDDEDAVAFRNDVRAALGEKQ